LPTPKPVRLDNVGLGFADRGLSYVNATWAPGEPGAAIGAGVRVQKIAFSLCRKPKLHLEGRIALTALPGDDGKPALTVPNAGLIFQSGDPWSLRVEAPAATLAFDRKYEFSDLHLDVRGDRSASFGGRLKFAVDVDGDIPVVGS